MGQSGGELLVTAGNSMRANKHDSGELDPGEGRNPPPYKVPTGSRLPAQFVLFLFSPLIDCCPKEEVKALLLPVLL